MEDYICDSFVWTIISNCAESLRDCNVPESIITSFCENSYYKIIGQKVKKGDIKVKKIGEKTTSKSKKSEFSSSAIENFIESKKEVVWVALDDGRHVLYSFPFGNGYYPVAGPDAKVYAALNVQNNYTRPLQDVEKVVLKQRLIDMAQE